MKYFSKLAVEPTFFCHIGNSVTRRTHEVSKALFCHFFAIIPFIRVNIIIFSSFSTYNMSYCDGKIYVV